jgi:LEA14-like dessication related protein
MERVGILLLLFIPLLHVSCLSWFLEKPTFTLQEIALSPRSLTEMNLLLVIEVNNPNRFDFTLKSLEYTIYLNDENIGKGRLEKEHWISSSSKTRILVPIDVKFTDLGGSLKAILMSRNLPYKIEGNAGIKLAFENIHFPFSKEGRINLNGLLP